MNALPFHLVTLTHPDWEAALACAKRLPADALPELRLDLFPDADPEALVDALKRRCLVTCRRMSEGGQWPDADESERLARLAKAVRGRPAWMDLEWDLPVPAEIQAARTHVRLLRSVHVAPGVFDLEARVKALPDGEAFKWVGHAGRLGDNGRLRAPLAWARDHGVALSAFLMGPKGIAGRAMQAAWGGAFTYAAPDDGPPAAPGQLPLETLRAWRCARLHPGYGLCGVIGEPVLHSRGPAFHNPRFQRAYKDLLYVPLLCGDAEEAAEALEALGILGLSITAPLKRSLPAALGLAGPLNTLWRRAPGDPWEGANTDAEAFGQSLSRLAPGPVLLLGSGGVAETTRAVLEAAGRPALQASRRDPVLPAAVAAFAPAGVVQATALGMAEEDPAPFPDLLDAARSTARWAVEWIYKEDTAFAAWARDAGLALVSGGSLFEAQAEGQSRRFVEGCGGE
ncbi:bifunctional type I 3-dehydroquinate dehydratase/shikimate dehydrogenase [Geothrix sp. 21YS21S-4]|uniref:bifunctional type I 3-dehydroquinate dehydratase/shikimate dehydrogenase n=1 Tax=Geothrix sp. 21YS21S-4 TaxID=3068889 RepID=UPI0027B9EC9D|nr:bifunctional type I 3-dehydroquinate dehydratase/shikimate dehydrogenase [Geothrix sp. 21YS21S-4]